jgi:molybdopterin molybdotransferase
MTNGLPPSSNTVQTSVQQELTVQGALARVLAQVDALGLPKATEQVELLDALDRILGATIVSPIDVPPHDNSAMDGFAFDGSQLVKEQALTLKVVGTTFAGTPWTTAIAPGECLSITTGAVMPPGLTTVAPKELVQHCSVEGLVTIPAGRLSNGDNRRFKGEDLAKGKAALAAGERLGPAHLGLVASLGLSKVTVLRPLTVAVFSTGNEILSIGEDPRPGAVYDSNRYTVHGMLRRLGCAVLDLGKVPDDPMLLEAAFAQASRQADVIISSGGVSVGEADHTKLIMARLGDDPNHKEQGVAFWRIAMRPGRPMAFGTIRRQLTHAADGQSQDRVLVFGLPGNPVAVMVTFLAFVRPALQRLTGQPAHQSALTLAISTTSIRKKPGRTEYQRGVLTQGDKGHVGVATTGSQGSGVLSSMTQANCLIVLEHDQTDVQPGDLVMVMPFTAFL